MTLTRVRPAAEVAAEQKKRANRVRLRGAIDKIAATCNLTTPEKRALKHRLTNAEA